MVRGWAAQGRVGQLARGASKGSPVGKAASVLFRMKGRGGSGSKEWGDGGTWLVPLMYSFGAAGAEEKPGGQPEERLTNVGGGGGGGRGGRPGRRPLQRRNRGGKRKAVKRRYRVKREAMRQASRAAIVRAHKRAQASIFKTTRMHATVENVWVGGRVGGWRAESWATGQGQESRARRDSGSVVQVR